MNSTDANEHGFYKAKERDYCLTNLYGACDTRDPAVGDRPIKALPGHTASKEYRGKKRDVDAIKNGYLIEYEGEFWQSLEHAWQARKFKKGSPTYIEIRDTPTARWAMEKAGKIISDHNAEMAKQPPHTRDRSKICDDIESQDRWHGIDRDSGIQYKVDLMLKLAIRKFTIPELENALLETGNKYLAEHSKYSIGKDPTTGAEQFAGDDFWGSLHNPKNDLGPGENFLGMILTELRGALRATKGIHDPEARERAIYGQVLQVLQQFPAQPHGKRRTEECAYKKAYFQANPYPTQRFGKYVSQNAVHGPAVLRTGQSQIPPPPPPGTVLPSTVAPSTTLGAQSQPQPNGPQHTQTFYPPPPGPPPGLIGHTSSVGPASLGSTVQKKDVVSLKLDGKSKLQISTKATAFRAIVAAANERLAEMRRNPAHNAADEQRLLDDTQAMIKHAEQIFTAIKPKIQQAKLHDTIKNIAKDSFDLLRTSKVPDARNNFEDRYGALLEGMSDPGKRQTSSLTSQPTRPSPNLAASAAQSQATLEHPGPKVEDLFNHIPQEARTKYTKENDTFKKDGKDAFTQEQSRIVVHSQESDVVKDLVNALQNANVKKFGISGGTPEEQAQIWKVGSERGIHVTGYNPSQKEIENLLNDMVKKEGRPMAGHNGALNLADGCDINYNLVAPELVKPGKALFVDEQGNAYVLETPNPPQQRKGQVKCITPDQQKTMGVFPITRGAATSQMVIGQAKSATSNVAQNPGYTAPQFRARM